MFSWPKLEFYNVKSLLEYFTGYITVLELKSFNNDIEVRGEIASDILKLASHLVSINLFDINGNLMKYKNESGQQVEIKFKLQVNINLLSLFKS